MRKNVSERTFKCPNCNTIHKAFKKSSRRTAIGHIKHMYCYKCKEIVGMEQVSNY